MQLGNLLEKLNDRYTTAAPLDLVISGVHDDSRTVRPGGLFIARGGLRTDGKQYIDDAIARGAVAVVIDDPSSDTLSDDHPTCPVVVVPNAAQTASRLAHAMVGEPSRHMKVVGITGTNGKTTTAYLIRHLLNRASQRCGMIGTVQIDDGRQTTEATMTTPGAVRVAQLMGTMRDNDCRACAMEVSSHALNQHRVDGVHFMGGAFTNLTGDHLDYHGSMEQYAAAKARLFAMLDPGGVAVVNDADAWSARMVRDCPARVVRFGFAERCDYRARDIAITAQGSHFVLMTPDGEQAVHMRLIGRHNIENALTAAAVAGEALGLSVHQIARGLAATDGAPGRLQVVPSDHPHAVLVDYAHTDDALRNVLSALRPLTRGRLRVLFGCGGDRDRTKRPRMARVACELADAVYITSDNPRTENPDAIIHDILTGIDARQTSGKVVVVPDRRSAIERILSDAGKDDVVLIAGKGHENYQIIGEQKRHFDDVEEAARAMNGAAKAPWGHQIARSEP